MCCRVRLLLSGSVRGVERRQRKESCEQKRRTECAVGLGYCCLGRCVVWCADRGRRAVSRNGELNRAKSCAGHVGVP
jgi:hypothetical protein